MPRISKQQIRLRNPAKFKRLVEEAVKRLALTQSAVARRAGIDAGHLSRALQLQGGKALGKDKVLALASVLSIPKNELLNAAGYQPDGPAVNINDVSLLRSEGGPPLRIVTDPRFVDSAIFMWIFSEQPFRQIGMDCDLVKTDWANVPHAVASGNSPAIGFYNRRAALRRGPHRFVRVNYWTDLCMYKGYALMARPGAAERDFGTLGEAEKFLKKLIADHRSGSKATIITIGGDTMWRLYTPLTPVLRDADFAFEHIPDADLALRTFLEGAGDLFLGGLPQRLAARKVGCYEVLSFANNPLLFSLNSLIFSEALKDRQGIMSAASGLWFKTIAQAKADPSAMKSLQNGCLRLLDNLKVDQHCITADLIAEVLSDERYEVFPDRPTDLFDELLSMVATTFRHLTANKIHQKVMEEVFDSMAETLDREVDKEKYPAVV